MLGRFRYILRMSLGVVDDRTYQEAIKLEAELADAAADIAHNPHCRAAACNQPPHKNALLHNPTGGEQLFQRGTACQNVGQGVQQSWQPAAIQQDQGGEQQPHGPIPPKVCHPSVYLPHQNSTLQKSNCEMYQYPNRGAFHDDRQGMRTAQQHAAFQTVSHENQQRSQHLALQIHIQRIPGYLVQAAFRGYQEEKQQPQMNACFESDQQQITGGLNEPALQSDTHAMQQSHKHSAFHSSLQLMHEPQQQAANLCCDHRKQHLHSQEEYDSEMRWHRRYSAIQFCTTAVHQPHQRSATRSCHQTTHGAYAVSVSPNCQQAAHELQCCQAHDYHGDSSSVFRQLALQSEKQNEPIHGPLETRCRCVQHEPQKCCVSVMDWHAQKDSRPQSELQQNNKVPQLQRQPQDPPWNQYPMYALQKSNPSAQTATIRMPVEGLYQNAMPGGLMCHPHQLYQLPGNEVLRSPSPRSLQQHTGRRWPQQGPAALPENQAETRPATRPVFALQQHKVPSWTEQHNPQLEDADCCKGSPCCVPDSYWHTKKISPAWVNQSQSSTHSEASWNNNADAASTTATRPSAQPAGINAGIPVVRAGSSTATAKTNSVPNSKDQGHGAPPDRCT